MISFFYQYFICLHWNYLLVHYLLEKNTFIFCEKLLWALWKSLFLSAFLFFVLFSRNLPSWWIYSVPLFFDLSKFLNFAKTLSQNWLSIRTVMVWSQLSYVRDACYISTNVSEKLKMKLQVIKLGRTNKTNEPLYSTKLQHTRKVNVKL